MSKSIVSLVALGALVASAVVADWPQFRGPGQDGHAAPFTWPEAPALEVVWQVPLGSGYSAVSVVGAMGVTFYGDGTHDIAVGFDVATGATRWRYEIAPMYEGHSGSDDGPVSTPVIDDGVVYGVGPRGHLFALRLTDGTPLWQRELAQAPLSREPFYGYGTAPLVVDDVVVVQTGGTEGHAVSAFDRATGEHRWSAGDDSVHYQSPAHLTLAGVAQVVAVTDKQLFGLDPASGDVLWQHAHGLVPEEAFTQAFALGDDRFLVGSLDEVVAYRLARAETGFTVTEQWRSPALKNSYAVPVLVDGRLYGFNGSILHALDATSGERLWRSRPPGGHGLIVVGDLLAMVGSDGALVVAAASADAYDERARVALFDRAPYTAPAFADGIFYVRDLETLAAVRVVEGSVATEAPAEAAAEAEIADG